MKKLIIFSAIALFLVNAGSFAQTTTYKLGHINVQEVLASMPESDSAQAKLQRESKALEDQLQAMQTELNSKYQRYLTSRDSLTELIKQTKEAEIQDLQDRIQKFQTNAQQTLQKRRAELLQPIYERAENAIKEVSKENNFTYVFDLSVGAVVYYAENSEDISPLVKKKLGITNVKPKPAEAAPVKPAAATEKATTPAKKGKRK